MSYRQFNFLMEKFLQKLLLPITIIAIFSCTQIKRKGDEVIHKAKETVAEKKDVLIDKIIPQFDAATPDTKFNKQRFSEFFEFYPTSDVKNLYCYSDQLGIDASYWFAFECNDSTVQKIISKLRLTIKPKKEYRVTRDISGNVIDSMLTYNGNGLQGGLNSTPTSWWDTAFINKTNPYAKIKENLYWYLYHDTKNKKVYFLTFDT